jgi:hypothetical protein
MLIGAESWSILHNAEELLLIEPGGFLRRNRIFRFSGKMSLRPLSSSERSSHMSAQNPPTSSYLELRSQIWRQ